MKTAAIAIGLVLLAGLRPTTSATEVEMPTGPNPAASAISASQAWKNLRDKLKGGSKAEAAPPAAAPPATAAAPPAPAPVAPQPTAAAAEQSPPASETATPTPAKAAAPLKIKEFASGTKLSREWNDGHCKNLVEPFGLSDSAASLGKVKALGLMGSALAKVTGKPAAHTDSRAEIRSAARQLNWLPMPVEIKIGQRMHESQTGLLREDKKSGAEAYARARRILGEVLAQVKETHPYQFQIFVTTASEGNAEAAPGGFIYVDKNLVDKESEEPRARFAIAHEVSHVLQRHRTRETQMRLADGVDSLEGLAKLMAAAQHNSDAIFKTALDLKRLFVRHSEQQELQSDGCAVRLLDSMTHDRTEMTKSINAFVQSLPKPGKPEPPEKVTAEAVFTELSDGKFSRHPSTDQRVRNLNRRDY